MPLPVWMVISFGQLALLIWAVASSGPTIEMIGKYFLFGGILLAIFVQLYITALAFRYRVLDGLFCLIIPAYILFYARREETRQTQALWVLGVGIVTFLAGTAVLSGFAN
ncbi:MAG: hypothetical protein HY618_07465 [Candidatus Tectomicrobia bacterium]|uniref:Uncharacterized protein n=1 Tax=Tectimicrobiota bacterium TaxID=2528274 RepID=A0A932ZV10_UNCTE|nr:hypothetical protein [Candidatus Tectomicrobia bacterium]